MAFGKQKSSDDSGDSGDEVTSAPGTDDDEPDGPFDIDDFDDPSVATEGRLDLGSVLIPLPEAGQVQVELTQQGVPSAVWVVTPNGRFTVAAYAAPKTAGLWREVATELADSLRKDGAEVRDPGRPVGPRGRRRGAGRPGTGRRGAVHRHRRLPVDDPLCRQRRRRRKSTRWPTKLETRWPTQ